MRSNAVIYSDCWWCWLKRLPTPLLLLLLATHTEGLSQTTTQDTDASRTLLDVFGWCHVLYMWVRICLCVHVCFVRLRPLWMICDLFAGFIGRRRRQQQQRVERVAFPRWFGGAWIDFANKAHIVCVHFVCVCVSVCVYVRTTLYMQYIEIYQVLLEETQPAAKQWRCPTLITVCGVLTWLGCRVAWNGEVYTNAQTLNVCTLCAGSLTLYTCPFLSLSLHEPEAF